MRRQYLKGHENEVKSIYSSFAGTRVVRYNTSSHKYIMTQKLIIVTQDLQHICHTNISNDRMCDGLEKGH